MPYSLCRFDEVFGELVDGLVAVPGNDALIVPDGGGCGHFLGD